MLKIRDRHARRAGQEGKQREKNKEQKNVRYHETHGHFKRRIEILHNHSQGNKRDMCRGYLVLQKTINIHLHLNHNFGPKSPNNLLRIVSMKQIYGKENNEVGKLRPVWFHFQSHFQVSSISRVEIFSLDFHVKKKYVCMNYILYKLYEFGNENVFILLVGLIIICRVYEKEILVSLRIGLKMNKTNIFPELKIAKDEKIPF